MRYLNKIIFLNSAHIPYAEVKLDGNVHFIGTQGVGKSTLVFRRRRKASMLFTFHTPILTLSMK